ncbi:MAG: 3-oxoacyl-ACP synthase III [Candidatus Adiutrix sp.]
MTFPKYDNVVIVGLARDEAPFKVKSSDIENRLKPVMSRLKLPLGLLAALTGIQMRNLYALETKPSQAASAASLKLFKKLDFDRQKLDLLYSTSVCRDHVEPSTASIVQCALNLGGQVKSLDIGSACLGFLDGMDLAALQIENGLAQYALIVAGENSAPILEATISRLMDPKTDRPTFFKNFATLTLGSGGVAMLLGHRKNHPQAPRLLCSVSRSDASANNLCRGDADQMETDATALLTAGVSLAQETFALGQKTFNWHPSAFSRLICHQVSEVNTTKFRESIGFDENILIKTFPLYGNMGPVAIAYTLDLAFEGGLFKTNDSVALMGIGSGLCCTMMEIKI